MTFQGTGIPEAGTLMTDREVARPGTRGGDASPRLAGPGRLALLAGSVTALVSASLAGSALGFLSKEACRAGAWNVGIEQYQAHCYTDIYPLYFSEGLSAGKVPYLGHPVEYPVIIGAAMQAAAWVVSPISDVFIRGREFFDVTVILLTLCTVAAVLATAYLAGPSRRWTALLVALSPAVILAAFINCDLIAMSLATLGMAAWAGRRGVLAGVLLGLAVATKFYPVFLLGPLLLLCLRAGRLRAFWVTACAAAATWLAVNLPVAIAAPAGWSRFYLLFGIACVLIAVLALAAPRRPRVPQLYFLVIAAFLLFNKVWSPQYVIWLAPLVVLARPRLAAFALWQIAEIGYFLGIWAYLITIIAGPGAPGGIGTGPYFTTVLARFCTVALLAGLVVRDILHPQADVVRRDGADDPAGGVLSGAPDRFVLRLRLGLRQARAGALPPAPR